MSLNLFSDDWESRVHTWCTEAYQQSLSEEALKQESRMKSLGRRKDISSEDAASLKRYAKDDVREPP